MVPGSAGRVERGRGSGSIASAGGVGLGAEGVREEGQAGKAGASNCMEQSGVREQAAQQQGWWMNEWGEDKRGQGTAAGCVE